LLYLVSRSEFIFFSEQLTASASSWNWRRG